MDPPVSLRDVGVRFRVRRRSRLGKAPRLIGAGKWTLWGLDGVTFDVARGEVLGLIGPNGAGKSTLLRVVAGIFRPDRGTIAVRGRVTPFLTPSAGLSASLSGWENIELGAVLLGLSRNEARRIAPEIADFTGLGEFLDAPTATYSSGMSARLGFALAAFTDPEILVLDEVLGAGDQEFRERSTAKIKGVISTGRTVIMATHSLPTLQELCHRVLRLEQGRVVEVGTPEEVTRHYLDDLHRKGRTGELRRFVRSEAPGTAPRPSDGRPKVSAVVAAFDEGRHIETCLHSLQAQTYRPLEIIVVDDGSTDGTATRVGRFSGVRLLRQPHRGAGAARNLGARSATGQILVFADADMTFPPDFIERLVRPMVDGDAAGTFTRDIRVANGNRRWARAHMLGRGLPPDSHFPPGFPSEWDNFRALWLADFLRVGGFDEIGHGEDMTLARKLGARAVAVYAPCYHYEPDTLRDIFRSALWVGRGQRITESPVGPVKRYGPWRSVPRAIKLAMKNRMAAIVVYRILWDTGVLLGWATRDRRRSPGK